MKQKVFPSMIVALSLYMPSIGLAGNFTAFGPENYIRGTGSPVTVSNNSFAVLNPNTSYTLRINNGGLTDGELKKVSSSVISLNGAQVVGPSEFNQNVTIIEKPITLASANDLSVELRGKPGGGIAIQIIGVDNDPPTINAAANPAPNAPGWHKSDPIVSFTCGDTTSGVASCPGPITINTEAANQLISGTATDRAGNRATASVTLNLDKTPPAIAVSSPANGATLGNSPVTVSGTITESLSGIASIGCQGNPAALSGSTFTCDVPLADGPNTITVDAIDIAGNAGSSSINVVLKRLSIEITSPAAGSVIHASSVIVTGVVDAPGEPEVGVSVNGFAASINGNQWAVAVPILPGSQPISAVAVTITGVQATDTITVNATQVIEPLLLRAVPVSGVLPLTVGWEVINQTGRPLVQFELDETGGGTFGPPTTTFAEAQTTYTEPGLLFPALRATDDQGTIYTATTIVSVEDPQTVTARFQGLWAGFKERLRGGDIQGALARLTPALQMRFEAVFQQLGPDLPVIAAGMGDLEVIEQVDDLAETVIVQQENGVPMLYFIYFRRDSLGRWLIEEM